MTTTIYGIRNCDTMRKALAWLGGAGVEFTFHDYRTRGADRTDVRRWCRQAGWQTVLNTKSRTFRALQADVREGLDEERAIALMIADPTMIKRPVLVTGDTVEVGFDPERYARLFSRR